METAVRVLNGGDYIHTLQSELSVPEEIWNKKLKHYLQIQRDTFKRELNHEKKNIYYNMGRGELEVWQKRRDVSSTCKRESMTKIIDGELALE